MAWSKLSNNIENRQKRRGLIIGISESAKDRGAIPTSIIWTDTACVVFNLCGFQRESLFSGQGTLGLQNSLLFAMQEELESSPRLLNCITSKSEK